jgi:hypothetical protein
MTKLSKFQNSSKIDTSAIWGGMACYTLQTDKGVTTNPCGESDDQHYMVLDSNSISISINEAVL